MKLKSILYRYEILSKCVAITTHNARNFKSCLKYHNGDCEELKTLMNDQLDEQSEMLFQLDFDDLENIWCTSDELAIDSTVGVVPLTAAGTENNNSDSDDDGDTNESDFKISEMPSHITQKIIDDTSAIVLLSNRIDCGAHTLNLIGKTDAFDALKNVTYQQQYVSVFTKLNQIWHVNSTRLGRETFHKYLRDKTIQKPHRIRWNRIYDSLTKFSFIFNLQFTILHLI